MVWRCLTINPLYGFVVFNELTGTIPSELGRLTTLKQFVLCKFAAVSRSELDTVIVGISVLRFTSSTIVVVNTQLTGNLDTIFCNNDVFSSLLMYADCAGSPPEVVCSCCVQCF
jgi:hypothetical protein